MLFLTYNIGKGDRAPRRKRGDIKRLSAALAQRPAEVVLCQEVFHEARSAGSQSDALAQALSMTAYYAPNVHRRRGHHGNATFTLCPVEHWENVDLPTNALERRGMLYVRIILPTGPLHVFNVHLGLTQKQRWRQLETIHSGITSLCAPQDALVLAGDFNDWNGRLDKAIIADLGLQNSCENTQPEERRTWHARRPIFHLDRIYVRGLAVCSAQRLTGEPWVGLSDHLPLLVDLRIVRC